jgi:hypothetical protein
MTRTFPAVPARLHRLMCTGLFAAAVALGANTIGTAPVAVAAPNGGTWDLDAYEECLKVMRPWESPTQELLDKILKYCCEVAAAFGTATRALPRPLRALRTGRLRPELVTTLRWRLRRRPHPGIHRGFPKTCQSTPGPLRRSLHPCRVRHEANIVRPATRGDLGWRADALRVVLQSRGEPTPWPPPSPG